MKADIIIVLAMVAVVLGAMYFLVFGGGPPSDNPHDSGAGGAL